jgi:hypothetical protein
MANSCTHILFTCISNNVGLSPVWSLHGSGDIYTFLLISCINNSLTDSYHKFYTTNDPWTPNQFLFKCCVLGWGQCYLCRWSTVFVLWSIYNHVTIQVKFCMWLYTSDQRWLMPKKKSQTTFQKFHYVTFPHHCWLNSLVSKALGAACSWTLSKQTPTKWHTNCRVECTSNKHVYMIYSQGTYRILVC